MTEISLRDLASKYKLYYNRYVANKDRDDFLKAKVVYALYKAKGGSVLYRELEQSNDFIGYHFMFKCLSRLGSVSERGILTYAKSVVSLLNEELSLSAKQRGISQGIKLQVSTSKQERFSVIQVRVAGQKFTGSDFACSLTFSLQSIASLIESCTKCLVSFHHNFFISDDTYFKPVYTVARAYRLV